MEQRSWWVGRRPAAARALELARYCIPTSDGWLSEVEDNPIGYAAAASMRHGMHVHHPSIHRSVSRLGPRLTPQISGVALPRRPRRRRWEDVQCVPVAAVTSAVALLAGTSKLPAPGTVNPKHSYESRGVSETVMTSGKPIRIRKRKLQQAKLPVCISYHTQKSSCRMQTFLTNNDQLFFNRLMNIPCAS
ncbi:hypothetical protein BHE74_00004824 [Ensete ventricosum]|uniref:Uncharacterized protein n=1 Tax=Ensete ventricosum TaxID=4639 RepID=A0A427B7F8_ENSVE|nr:hypothetical protein B296_00014704 [Ensete ventricosum]RWW07531.1 hypothetical protein GW17_00029085 [Ensete ventricosum]RWW86404.1 hypothetical protein BHE74_00004824 [Ensete ventricosum]RZR78301.1 hypothetical protein BHM03_00003573 [Ensete ventricosum]